MRKIVFLGGIHGAGKSQVAQRLCSATGLHYLSASNLLRWSEIQGDPGNKAVEDIPNAQDRLIEGLDASTSESGQYLLDGHYCLFGARQAVEPIPMDTFRRINPSLLLRLIASPDEVARRLEGRDGVGYSVEALCSLQEAEGEYIDAIRSELDIDVLQIDGEPTDAAMAAIRSCLASGG